MISNPSNAVPGNATLSKIKAFGTRALFWIGACLFVVDNFISFVPGAEVGFFIVAAILIAFGLFIPKWFYRIAALVLIVACSLLAIDGHRRGVEYREHLDRYHMDGFD